MKERFAMRDKISGLQELPSIPLIAQKILSLDMDTEKGERDLIRFIASDPQISAKIIGLANTPLFGAFRKVINIEDAAHLLGLMRVKSVATSIALMSLYSKRQNELMDIQRLWFHSLSVALSLRMISSAMPSNLRPKEDQIFLAGLLHDIGFAVLASADLPLSNRFHAAMMENPNAHPDIIEREILPMTHSEIGALLCQHWGLPEDLVEIIFYHHDPDLPEAPKNNPLARMLYVAEHILPTFENQKMSDVTQKNWEILGIEESDIPDLTNSVANAVAQAKEMAEVFK